MSRDAFPTRAELEAAVEWSQYETNKHLVRLLAVAQWALDQHEIEPPGPDSRFSEAFVDGYMVGWQDREQRALPPFRDEEPAP